MKQPPAESLLSAVAGQDVKEMVDLVLIEHSHLCGALRTLHWVVNVIAENSRFLSSSPRPLLLFQLMFVAQHLVSFYFAVHHKHGSILSVVLFMPE